MYRLLPILIFIVGFSTLKAQFTLDKSIVVDTLFFPNGQIKTLKTYEWDYYIDTISRIDPITLEQETIIQIDSGFRLNGVELHFSLSGDTLVKGYNLNGKKEGYWVFIKNKQIIASYTFENGLKNGGFTKYNRNGVEVSSGNFNKGLKIGNWIECSNNLQYCFEGIYSLVITNTDTAFKETGYSTFTPESNRSGKHGTWSIYNYNGELVGTIEYKYGIRKRTTTPPSTP